MPCLAHPLLPYLHPAQHHGPSLHSLRIMRIPPNTDSRRTTTTASFCSPANLLTVFLLVNLPLSRVLPKYLPKMSLSWFKPPSRPSCPSGQGPHSLAEPIRSYDPQLWLLPSLAGKHTLPQQVMGCRDLLSRAIYGAFQVLCWVLHSCPVFPFPTLQRYYLLQVGAESHSLASSKSLTRYLDPNNMRK